MFFASFRLIPQVFLKPTHGKKVTNKKKTMDEFTMKFTVNNGKTDTKSVVSQQ